MDIVYFYNGLRGNQNGDRLDEMLNWSNYSLEMEHDWIQWAFPSNEPSGINDYAPVLTLAESEAFKSDVELQKKVQVMFERFLNFLEFKMVVTEGEIQISPMYEEIPWWINHFNHNMLRVTRVLKSLRLTGNENYAAAFFEALKPFECFQSQNTWDFWKNAALNPLW